ncbi:MAG: glutaredoxin family protein [Halobacteria archaeon]|nr:glutaredoxin family protein [Halobacteria archaeon]
MSVNTVRILVRPNCPLCQKAVETVESVLDEVEEVDIETQNVESSPGLEEMYGDELPVVMVDGVVRYRLEVDADDLRDRLT